MYRPHGLFMIDAKLYYFHMLGLKRVKRFPCLEPYIIKGLNIVQIEYYL
jgi:hypothetical protein